MLPPHSVNEARHVSLAECRNCSYSIGVDIREKAVSPQISAEKLALAQRAFREFHARCFWFMRPDAEIVAEEVHYICERLRADGGRAGFLIAAEICR